MNILDNHENAVTSSPLQVAPNMEDAYVIIAFNEDANISVYGPYLNVTSTQVYEIAEQIQLADSSGNTFVTVQTLGRNYVPAAETEE